MSVQNVVWASFKKYGASALAVQKTQLGKKNWLALSLKSVGVINHKIKDIKDRDKVAKNGLPSECEDDY